MQEALFSQALRLSKPWEVQQVQLDVKASRIDLHIAWGSRSAACPACGAAEQQVHDHRLRSWRHLDFFQFEAMCTASCPASSAAPAIARARSRFPGPGQAAALP